MAEYLTVDQAVVGSTPIRHPKGKKRDLFVKEVSFVTAILQQRGLFKVEI
jgi:hypothetical protein